MNFKYLSPRFAPIMPDEDGRHGRLSPSILPFYNDDSGNQILPVPKLLEATGMSQKDREKILELTMEVSGARKLVDEAVKILKSADVPEMDDALSGSAQKTMKMVKDVKDSFTRRQKRAMEKKGFALMEPHQLRRIMEDQGVAGRKDVFDIEAYEKKTLLERKEMVWDIVRNAARGGAANGTVIRRSKRQNFDPHILTPTVLTPIMFAPVYGLSVLSPTVLSPGIFTPLLLNPAVLSPYVFSPTVGIPFILSPYVLSPYVFSPLVMAPFILTPYVLSPNVFNPYVLSPLVLSPLVLCPDVVSPMVLGGVVLTPGVLSPSFFSKSVLMVNVLSPTFLS
ncbi:unnamed protein product [Caenorhabditis auriculariae]|uniref:Uncharacterized protein n=1 Tax=Caenorhabditis auriculariae TaxID=2777116 RepID=A0A8S1HI69_9PELO|nr:unnamed protein product [Caenorhabditis auriculariae]